MIAITSIAPTHANGEIQQQCVDSWIKNGMSVYSINTTNEIEVLRGKYPDVEFVHTTVTGEVMFGKPYPLFNSVIELALNQYDEDIVIINSDIELGYSPGVFIHEFENRCKDSVGVIQRQDYNTEKGDGQTYIYGFDVFLIKKIHFKLFPHSIYALGQTWWDYWLPYTAVKKGLKIHRINGVQAYHKAHKQQWDDTAWRKITKYFAWENELAWSKTAEQTTGRILQSINNSLNLS
jgi:hypothetical protein